MSPPSRPFLPSSLLSRVVHLHCSDPDSIRLVGGTSRCNGQIELHHNDQWRPLDSFSWDHRLSKFICHRLSCGSPTSVANIPSLTSSSWWIENSCVQSNALLRDCASKDQPSHNRIEIHCSGKCQTDTNSFHIMLPSYQSEQQLLKWVVSPTWPLLRRCQADL